MARSGTNPTVISTGQSGTTHVIVDSGAINATVSGTIAFSNTSIAVTQGTSPWVISGAVTATVAGTVAVSNFPASQQVTQGTSPWVTQNLVFANDKADVSGSAVTATVAGTVAVSNFPTTFAVTQSGFWNIRATVAGTVAVFNMGDPVVVGDALAGTTAGSLLTYPLLYNGTTFDRPRSGSPTADPGNTGVPAVQLHISDGTNIRKVTSGQADTVGSALMVPIVGFGFNGGSFDRLRSTITQGLQVDILSGGNNTTNPISASDTMLKDINNSAWAQIVRERIS